MNIPDAWMWIDMTEHEQHIDIIHIFNRSESPNWWMWWFDSKGKRIQRSTGMSKNEFMREQAQSIISSDDSENSRLRERIYYTLQNIVNRGTLEKLLEITQDHSAIHEDHIEEARRTIPELGNSF